MNVQELASELATKNFRPLYAIVGEESFMAERASALLLQALQANASDGTSTHRYNGNEIKTGDEVIDTLSTMSLLGGRPTVLIRVAEKLKKGVQERLAAYAEHPVQSATLILVATKLDGRSKLMTGFKKHGVMVECKPLYANQVPPWISLEVRRHEKRISQEAARYLADLVGVDMGQIADAVERLILYVGDRKLIELPDVEVAIAETAQRTIFEFTDAVGQRDRAKAIGILKNLLEHGEAPVGILAMLTRHMRLLLKAKEVDGRLPSESDIARYLSVHPFFAKNYLQQSRIFSEKELRQSFRSLSETDRELKSSRIPRHLLLENLLLKIV